MFSKDLFIRFQLLAIDTSPVSEETDARAPLVNVGHVNRAACGVEKGTKMLSVGGLVGPLLLLDLLVMTSINSCRAFGKRLNEIGISTNDWKFF